MAMLTCVQTFEQSLSLMPRLAFPSCCRVQVFCVFLDVAAEDGLHRAKWLPLRVQFHMLLHAAAPAPFSFWLRLRGFAGHIVVSLGVLRVCVGWVPSTAQNTNSNSHRPIYIHTVCPLLQIGWGMGFRVNIDQLGSSENPVGHYWNGRAHIRGDDDNDVHLDLYIQIVGKPKHLRA